MRALTSSFGRLSRPNYAQRFISTSVTLRAKGVDVGKQVWADTLDEVRAAGTYKTERVITTPQNSSIGVEGLYANVINFCANNYLGLADDPELEKAAKDTIDSHGLGLASVRFICGTQDIHKQLEKKIADFHGKEDTILYASCFDANAGIFETLLTPEDAIFSDALNHASIIDGMRLAKAQKKIYKHMDMADLEEHLKSSDARQKMIVTDGVFSMDGDIAPLDKICDLADKYNAMVFIDECHATGFLGKTGRGTPEYFGVEDRGFSSTLPLERPSEEPVVDTPLVPRMQLICLGRNLALTSSPTPLPLPLLVLP